MELSRNPAGSGGSKKKQKVWVLRPVTAATKSFDSLPDEIVLKIIKMAAFRDWDNFKYTGIRYNLSENNQNGSIGGSGIGIILPEPSAHFSPDGKSKGPISKMAALGDWHYWTRRSIWYTR